MLSAHDAFSVRWRKRWKKWCAATMLGGAVIHASADHGFESSARAGDWPQILGPHRNGVADDEQLPERWPKSGPAILWRAKLGQGYAGPAVVGSRVVVFHRIGAKERLECFDLKSGQSTWATDFACSYRGGIDPDLGPRCVPTIVDGAVVAYGVAGNLHCVSLADGKTRWSRDLFGDYQGDEGYFGAGSSPLVVESRVLVNVGGKSGAGLVALDLRTGETLWKAGDEAASYAAPTFAKLGEKPAAIFVTRLNCVAVDPATGAVLFRFPFGKRGPTVNAATPLVVDDRLFLSASYGIGAVSQRWNGQAWVAAWANDDTMSSQYATAVPFEKHLYGSHGREDVGETELRCVELATGKIAWSQSSSGVAHVLRAGDKLLVVNVDGTATLARANPVKFDALATAKIASQTTRAIPALSQGRLLVRTNERGGPGELLCVDVAAAE